MVVKRSVKDLETVLDYHRKQAEKLTKELEAAKSAAASNKKERILALAKVVSDELKALGFNRGQSLICFLDGSGYITSSFPSVQSVDKVVHFFIGNDLDSGYYRD